MIGMTKMATALREIARFAGARLHEDRGATAVEYGMIVALIAAIIVLTVQAVGLDVLGGFQDVDNAIP
jgi:pilus assembly protein Flp/PilA